MCTRVFLFLFLFFCYIDMDPCCLVQIKLLIQAPGFCWNSRPDLEPGPAFIGDPASIWDPACIRSFTVNWLVDNLPLRPIWNVVRCVQPKEPLDKCSDYYVHCLLLLSVSDKLKYSTVIGWNPVTWPAEILPHPWQQLKCFTSQLMHRFVYLNL